MPKTAANGRCHEMKVKYAIRYLVDLSVTALTLELGDNEVFRAGDPVSIPLKGSGTLCRTILEIVPPIETDPIPDEIRKGEDDAVILVNDIDPDLILCEHSMSCCKNLTPFREIRGGALSIYHFVDDSFTVPDRVIRYLKVGKPAMMSPGIYQHPFLPGHKYNQGPPRIEDDTSDLLGPYIYKDGIYTWDRDTWKYVVKYHLTLPQVFIDHVMSDEGLSFLAENETGCRKDYWKKKLDQSRGLNLLPADAGDVPLSDF